MKVQKLRFTETKELYEILKRRVAWWDLLVLGLLVWVESWLVEAKVLVEVDKAISEYEKLDHPEVKLPDPVYSEKESSVPGLPEMRLEAPWRRD